MATGIALDRTGYAARINLIGGPGYPPRACMRSSTPARRYLQLGDQVLWSGWVALQLLPEIGNINSDVVRAIGCKRYVLAHAAQRRHGHDAAASECDPDMADPRETCCPRRGQLYRRRRHAAARWHVVGMAVQCSRPACAASVVHCRIDSCSRNAERPMPCPPLIAVCIMAARAAPRSV